MIENQIQDYIQKQSLQRQEEGVRLTLQRLTAAPVAPTSQITALSLNPMAKDAVLAPDEAAWPLAVLALPSAEPFLDVKARHEAIRQRLDWAAQHLSDSCSQGSIEAARGKVDEAFGFLYWQDNRERVEEVLNLFSELRPTPECIPLPDLTVWERSLVLLRRAIAFIRSRYEQFTQKP